MEKELKYKEIIVDNCFYDEPKDFRCNANTISLAVLDKDWNQKYVDSPVTLDEELSIQKICNSRRMRIWI